MADHPLHRLGLEQIVVKTKHPLDAAVPFFEHHLEIALTGVLFDIIRLDAQASEAEHGAGGRDKKTPLPELVRTVSLILCERDLHQGCAAGIAVDLQPLHQQRERIILVFERIEHGAARAPQERGEVGVAGQAGAQRQHVDEVADDGLEFRPAPAGERAADQEIFLAGVAEELHLECGQQHCVERGRLGRRQRLEPANHVRLEPPGDGSAAPGEDGRTGPVGRQVEYPRRA